MTATVRALWRHDCDEACLFVGHLRGRDIYWHTFDPDFTPVGAPRGQWIVRFGNDGPSYQSRVGATLDDLLTMEKVL